MLLQCHLAPHQKARAMWPMVTIVITPERAWVRKEISFSWTYSASLLANVNGVR